MRIANLLIVIFVTLMINSDYYYMNIRLFNLKW